jgi:thioredoxin reductase (NADPH)
MPVAIHKVLIIGGGPAGLTAAIYAARANLQPACVEGWNSGGQLVITTDVENFPGFPEGITGPKLIEAIRRQAERFGTEFPPGDVTKVDFSARPFGVWVDGHEHRAESVIIATGATARWLEIPSEQPLRNRGVSACATCDGLFFKGQDVIVVGGGDTAMEEAHYLTGMCNSVTIVHRRGEFRASKAMQKRVLAHPKIKVVWHHAVDEIRDPAAKKVTSVIVKHVGTGERTEIPAGGVFVAIGHEPNTQLFKGVLDLHDNGYIKVAAGSTATNIPGVFAAGDVADYVYRQAVTAAGTGCMAALEAERFLASHA